MNFSFHELELAKLGGGRARLAVHRKIRVTLTTDQRPHTAGADNPFFNIGLSTDENISFDAVDLIFCVSYQTDRMRRRRRKEIAIRAWGYVYAKRLLLSGIDERWIGRPILGVE
jgi:hypothetical protein